MEGHLTSTEHCSGNQPALDVDALIRQQQGSSLTGRLGSPTGSVVSLTTLPLGTPR